MHVRLSQLLLVGGIVTILVLSLAVYAGILSSDWISLLACAPALLSLVAIVGGMLCGMFFFEAEEDETPPGTASEAGDRGGAGRQSFSYAVSSAREVTRSPS